MRSLYAGNLSWNVSNDDLLAFMQQGGNVLSAEVMSHPDGRSKGWGLVRYADEDGANTAMSMLNDQELDGRKIFLREDREPNQAAEGGASRGRGRGGRTRQRQAPNFVENEQIPSSTTLFVGNLPWSTKWNDLKDLFTEFNCKFADVKAGYDGRSRGYGIVRFDTEEEAHAALALNGYELNGRQILVRFDRQAGADVDQ